MSLKLNFLSVELGSIFVLYNCYKKALYSTSYYKMQGMLSGIWDNLEVPDESEEDRRSILVELTLFLESSINI